MAIYQIELNSEIEKLLKNLVHQTNLTVDELVMQGLLKLDSNDELIPQQRNFFDIYSQLDIGEGNNCHYSSADAKAGVKAILQRKQSIGKI